MIRMLLQYLLPILLPTIVYFLWIRLRPQPQTEDDPDYKHPWFWLAAGGVGLMLVTLAVFASIDGAPAGSSYTPPRVVDGKVIDGTFGPQTPDGGIIRK